MFVTSVNHATTTLSPSVSLSVCLYHCSVCVCHCTSACRLLHVSRLTILTHPHTQTVRHTETQTVRDTDIQTVRYTDTHCCQINLIQQTNVSEGNVNKLNYITYSMDAYA